MATPPPPPPHGKNPKDQPPPPPPHGKNPKSTAGTHGKNFRPQAKVDIFVIPEHTNGGFLYLPAINLNTQRNSFLAGVGSTIATYILFQLCWPLIRFWLRAAGKWLAAALILGAGYVWVNYGGLEAFNAKGASSSEKPADGETPKREGSRSGHERTQSSSSSSDRRSGGYSHTNGSGSTGSGKQHTPRS